MYRLTTYELFESTSQENSKSALEAFCFWSDLIDPQAAVPDISFSRKKKQTGIFLYKLVRRVSTEKKKNSIRTKRQYINNMRRELTE